MRALFLSTAAAALILAAPAAFAQDHHDKGPQGGAAHGGGAPHGGAASGSHGGGGPRGGGGGASHGHMGGMTGPSMSGPSHTGTTIHRGPVTTTASPAAVIPGGTVHNNMRGNNAMSGNAMQGGNTRGNNGHNVNGNGGGSHANFNRRNVTASHHYRYRGGAYSGPSGYSYRRWNYGQVLPSIYFSQNYWISDYEDYGLQDPPPGTVWVRYGDDALLIDQYTGEILEVVYDQFD